MLGKKLISKALIHGASPQRIYFSFIYVDRVLYVKLVALLHLIVKEKRL